MTYAAMAMTGRAVRFAMTLADERAGVIRIGGIPRERVPDVASRLVGAGIPLFRLEPHEPSLTDAYFALQQGSRGIA